MQIKGKMVVLAREIRGMTQQYLASRLSMSLYALSRVERGLVEAVSEPQALTIAAALEFPIEFFHQDAGPSVSAAARCCAAGKGGLNEAGQKRVRGVLTQLRINIDCLLGAARIVPCRELPTLIHEPSGTDPVAAAAAIRSQWNLPEGPIENLVGLIESAGVVVVRSDLHMSTLAATSLRTGGVPPLVLIDRAVPDDQARMMLAHQLAHLVMHEGAGESAEAEADAFANELLLPRNQMQLAFQVPARIAAGDLEIMKTHWRVPAATLLERARALNLIDPDTRNRLRTNVSMHRPAEPRPPLPEEATTLHAMLDCFMRDRGLGVEDLARLLRIGTRDLWAWYGTSILRAGTSRLAQPGNCAVVLPFARKRRAVADASG